MYGIPQANGSHYCKIEAHWTFIEWIMTPHFISLAIWNNFIVSSSDMKSSKSILSMAYAVISTYNTAKLRKILYLSHKGSWLLKETTVEKSPVLTLLFPKCIGSSFHPRQLYFLKNGMRSLAKNYLSLTAQWYITHVPANAQWYITHRPRARQVLSVVHRNFRKRRLCATQLTKQNDWMILLQFSKVFYMVSSHHRLSEHWRGMQMIGVQFTIPANYHEA